MFGVSTGSVFSKNSKTYDDNVDDDNLDMFTDHESIKYVFTQKDLNLH